MVPIDERVSDGFLCGSDSISREKKTRIMLMGETRSLLIQTGINEERRHEDSTGKQVILYCYFISKASEFVC